jgi:hypothetical protein
MRQHLVYHDMIALNRYLLVGKNHEPWLVTIAKLKFKRVIRGSFLFSCLVNIGHCWEYQPVEDLVISHSYNSIYAQVNGFSYSDYPFANQGQVYFYFSIVYFLVNFGVFFVFNTGIDG